MSEEGLKGPVVNQICDSLNGESVNITYYSTFPLIKSFHNSILNKRISLEVRTLCCKYWDNALISILSRPTD